MPNVEKALDLTSIPPIKTWIDTYFARKTSLPSNTSDLTNDGDGTDSNSPFATQTYVNANGGKINKIKVNNVEQTIDQSDKSVNITVPANVSDLTNDSGFQTATQVQTAIDTALTSAMRYKGSVASYSNLPASGNVVGDFYNVLDTGTNYAWDGTAWDKCGDIVDVSTLWSKSELTFATVAEVEAVLNGN